MLLDIFKPVTRVRSQDFFASAHVSNCFLIADGWEDRWVNSEHKSDLGKFTHTAGKFYHDAEDKGRKTLLIKKNVLVTLSDTYDLKNLNVFKVKEVGSS